MTSLDFDQMEADAAEDSQIPKMVLGLLVLFCLGVWAAVFALMWCLL
jgi:hypothetical protein